ncbi:hypothetical protein L204_101353 [Cryptococcus depauperatus]|nr:hypothetical protein L204_04022 [Cryptococcus depauperatus CBS 7855]
MSQHDNRYSFAASGGDNSKAQTNEDMQSFMNKIFSLSMKIFRGLPQETQDLFAAAERDKRDILEGLWNGTLVEACENYVATMVENDDDVKEREAGWCGGNRPSLQTTLSCLGKCINRDSSNTASKLNGHIRDGMDRRSIDSGLGGISFTGSRENTARLSTPDPQLEYLDPPEVDLDEWTEAFGFGHGGKSRDWMSLSEIDRAWLG